MELSYFRSILLTNRKTYLGYQTTIKQFLTEQNLNKDTAVFFAVGIHIASGSESSCCLMRAPHFLLELQKLIFSLSNIFFCHILLGSKTKYYATSSNLSKKLCWFFALFTFQDGYSVALYFCGHFILLSELNNGVYWAMFLKLYISGDIQQNK